MSENKLPAIEVGQITLPAHWASALVNGDFSGLDAEEAEKCQATIDALACRNESVVGTCDQDAEAYFRRGEMVLDYIVFINNRPTEAK